MLNRYKIDCITGCWNWTGATVQDGRAIVKIDGVRTHPARVFWELYKTPIPEGMLICHRCDNVLCVNPDHLFVGTPTDNMVDMSKKGRQWQQKLTDSQVIEIRNDARKASLVAKEYGVSCFTVYGIRNGYNRKHVVT